MCTAAPLTSFSRRLRGRASTGWVFAIASTSPWSTAAQSCSCRHCSPSSRSAVSRCAAPQPLRRRTACSRSTNGSATNGRPTRSVSRRSRCTSSRTSTTPSGSPTTRPPGSPRPSATSRLQAASAVGQSRLQAAWDSALRVEGVEAAQILLSAPDLAERASYVNVRNAFETLLKLGVVPVVNENDATATDEITFGDNDALAAQVAVLTRARLLVLLTEVDGVYATHPAVPGAELVADGAAAADAVLGQGSALGRGGMASKIGAARLAAAAGIPSVIASGSGRDILGSIVAGESRGTHFAAADVDGNSAFKLWLRYAK